ncbi:uncharacterized protein LOC120641818 [Panicum virgatum]|uniref:uncharacterized protein LOC120641818 n=1 Tax=Panicum virgatum TaxID=38727 RepID=UPI0019D68A9A|nr:uncharacterized protein LOC120641818 [Panicum virgatum]
MQSDPLSFPAVRAVGEPRRPTTFLARSPALPAACLPRRRRPDATEPWTRVVVVVDLLFPTVRAMGQARRTTAFLAHAGPTPACLSRRRRPDAAEPWPRVVVAVVLDGAAVAGPPPLALAGPCPRRGHPHQQEDGGGRSTISVAACGSRGPRSSQSPSQPGRRCKSHSNSDLLPRMMIRPMQPQRACSSSTDSVLLFLPPVNNANLWIKETPCYLNPIHDDLFQASKDKQGASIDTDS